MNKQILAFMKEYSKSHNITFSIEDMPDAGVAIPYERTIYIGKQHISCSSDEETISTFFHEVSHVKCFELGIFPLYHNKWRFDRKDRAKIRSQAWRAEKHVDLMGKKEMKNYFPDMKYIPSYLGKSCAWTRKAIVEYIE